MAEQLSAPAGPKHAYDEPAPFSWQLMSGGIPEPVDPADAPPPLRPAAMPTLGTPTPQFTPAQRQFAPPSSEWRFPAYGVAEQQLKQGRRVRPYLPQPNPDLQSPQDRAVVGSRVPRVHQVME